MLFAACVPLVCPPCLSTCHYDGATYDQWGCQTSCGSVLCRKRSVVPQLYACSVFVVLYRCSKFSAGSDYLLLNLTIMSTIIDSDCYHLLFQLLCRLPSAVATS